MVDMQTGTNKLSTSCGKTALDTESDLAAILREDQLAVVLVARSLVVVVQECESMYQSVTAIESRGSAFVRTLSPTSCRAPCKHAGRRAAAFHEHTFRTVRAVVGEFIFGKPHRRNSLRAFSDTLSSF